MRKLILDVSDMEFQTAGPFTARTNDDGTQRRDRESGLPQWAVKLIVWSGEGDAQEADTILVTVATDNPPSVNQMDFVKVSSLEVVPWVPKNGSGGVRLAYRAQKIEQLTSAKPVKAAS